MDILNRIPVLEEANSPAACVITLDDIQLIHKSFTLDNPMTFKIFLARRPDIILDERGIYEQIIERLERNERIKGERISAQLADPIFEPVKTEVIITPLPVDPAQEDPDPEKIFPDFPPSFTTDVYDA